MCAILDIHRGSANRGQIVGFSIVGALDDPSRATVRSFLLPRGVGGPFTRIRFPGALTTLAFGLNDRGQVTGAYNNPQFGELVHPSAE